MSHGPGAGPTVTRWLLVAIVLAGCGTGARGPDPVPPVTDLPGPGSGEVPGGGAGAAPGPGSGETPGDRAGPAGVAARPDPTGVPGAGAIAGDRPPDAILAGGAITGRGEPGAEGSFSWDTLVSDAPWIVLPDAIPAGGGPWSVALDPPLHAERWVARWARVTAGSAGIPVAGGSGSGGAIRIGPPPSPGAWGLQLEVWFGRGRHAAWYWTLAAVP